MLDSASTGQNCCTIFTKKEVDEWNMQKLL